MEQMRRRYWTREEDSMLLQCVNTNMSIHGKVKWNTVARALGIGKSGNSCLQRYNDHLAPGLKHTKLTDEEIHKIEMLLTLHHKKWATIARQLPGRTANDVKNWYYKQVAKEAKLNADGFSVDQYLNFSGLNNEDGLGVSNDSFRDLNVVDLDQSFNANDFSLADQYLTNFNDDDISLNFMGF